MKLVQNNVIYIPIYHAKYELFDLDYDSVLGVYNKTFKVVSNDFQSLFDCLTIQLLFWLNDFEEDRDPKMMEKLLFEIKGLDFYRFFYDYKSGFPYLIMEKYNGHYLYEDKIIEIKSNLNQNIILFNLEDDIKFEVSRDEFPQIFNCDSSDINKALLEMTNEKKLYFDGGYYYFINEKNYNILMSYMCEQVRFLNDIYKTLSLREITIINT